MFSTLSSFLPAALPALLPALLVLALPPPLLRPARAHRRDLARLRRERGRAEPQRALLLEERVHVAHLRVTIHNELG